MKKKKFKIMKKINYLDYFKIIEKINYRIILNIQLVKNTFKAHRLNGKKKGGWKAIVKNYLRGA